MQADWTVRFSNQHYQIEGSMPLKVRPKQRVLVRQHLDGTVTLWCEGEQLKAQQIEPGAREKVIQEKKGYDFQRRSENGRKNKTKSPWSLFNSGWLNQGKGGQSSEARG